VNKAIMQMDETTQQNAALVEETTSASQSMKEQAQELMRQVGSFKMTGSGREKPDASESGTKRASRTTLHASRDTRPAHQEPVGASNGKDRRQKDSEFEEF
jgi:methyl-accepting chemotaxis protein